ncbi:hypothetical protein BG006_001088 [Podila minutissima]|uniref:Uncharacterized protein n=1 Tax=Podila minutissima TaxID=64525 RepID=A0A9P5VP84_9FUNG|nr:hypothetical protein BG006_001088 [Podila minutissima]
MPTPGTKSFPFLEQIRVQMSEIEQILSIYSTKGTIRVETLPPSLVSFSDSEFSAIRPIIESMQRRYHVLHSQEFLLVMASKDEDATEEHLRRIRVAIAAIERMMHKNRASKYYAPLAKCLLSCYSKSGGVDIKALEKRYEALKDQEFQIMLLDMKNATAAREAQSAPGVVPIDHTAILTMDLGFHSSSSSSLLPAIHFHHDLPPSFTESQAAYIHIS